MVAEGKVGKMNNGRGEVQRERSQSCSEVLQEKANLQTEFEKREIVLQNKSLSSFITLILLEGARLQSPMQTGQLCHPNSKAVVLLSQEGTEGTEGARDEAQVQ